MKKFSGIDLHSDNSMVAVSDEEDRIVYQRLPEGYIYPHEARGARLQRDLCSELR